MSINVAIAGASGRMGLALCAYIQQNLNYKLVAALTSHNNPKLGQDVGLAHHLEAMGVQLSTTLPAQPIDVVIDFSVPAGTLALLPILVQRQLPIIVCATGYSSTEREQLIAASAKLPMLIAPNTSIGAVLLAELAKKVAAAQARWPFTANIFETHHTHKRDAPSGTAKMLQEVLLAGGYVGEIDMLSVRAADITGEHTITCHAEGETITLAHQARSRSIFAHGALAAGAWLVQEKMPARPGGYQMADMLF